MRCRDHHFIAVPLAFPLSGGNNGMAGSQKRDSPTTMFPKCRATHRISIGNFGDFPIHKKHTFSKYGLVCPFFSQNGTFSRAKIRSLIFLARKVQNSVFHHDKSKEP
jgi:hypothetical protein